RPTLFAALLSVAAGHLLFHLLLQGLKVEACALLHWRKLKKGLCRCANLVFYKYKAPELVSIPVVVVDRLVQPGPLERVQPKVDEDWPIRLDSAAEPTVRLIDEPVLEVIDAHRAKRRFGEVKDLVTLRRALARDQVGLVVTIEMDLVCPVADLLALLQFVD